MTHIESRPSKDSGWEYDFLVTFDRVTESQLQSLAHAFTAKGVAELTFSTSAGGISILLHCLGF
jgi:prephenate dehydratase